MLYEFANQVVPELVIHCAASYSDPDLWHRDTDINVAGGINAALVAKHHGARLIYFQTILPPVSSYAISKIASEHYQRIAGVPLTVFRIANIYGPRNLSGPVPTFFRRISDGQPCTIVDTRRDFVFIDDLVEIAPRMAEPESPGGVWHVGSGHDDSIAYVYGSVVHAMGVELDPNGALICT